MRPLSQMRAKRVFVDPRGVPWYPETTLREEMAPGAGCGWCAVSQSVPVPAHVRLDDAFGGRADRMGCGADGARESRRHAAGLCAVDTAAQAWARTAVLSTCLLL